MAVDFSEGASTALGRLRALPLASAPVIHLVHVVPVPTLTPLPVAKQIAKQQLDALVKQVKRRLRRARVTAEISSGRPADEIVRVAGERNAELIVAGRRGAGGFPRLMLGSTAERLVRLSPVPVLLVSVRSTPYKRALMPVDVADDAGPMVRAATRVLRAAASVDLLHVYWIYGAGYLRIGGASEAYIRSYGRRMREQAHDAIVPIAESLERGGFRVAVKLLNGDPRTIVERMLRATRPDLVVIGNHGRNALARALIGSVAAHVLRSATCDVLLVPIR